MLGALEALERGTTAIVDHHASPNAIEGSLSVIADACAEVGVRVSCCYEVTDRNGPDGHAGRTGRERALPPCGRTGLCRCACLLHALARRRLEAVAGPGGRPRGRGPHPRRRGSRRLGRRRPGWRASQPTTGCSPIACTSTGRLRGTVAHNPRSNMNNAVGYARPARLENPVVLGTDGIGGDMLEEFRIAYVRHREDDVTASPVSGLVVAGGRQRPRPRGRRRPCPLELRADRPVAPRLHARRAAGRGRRRRRGRARERPADPSRPGRGAGPGTRAGRAALGSGS